MSDYYEALKSLYSAFVANPTQTTYLALKTFVLDQAGQDVWEGYVAGVTMLGGADMMDYMSSEGVEGMNSLDDWSN